MFDEGAEQAMIGLPDREIAVKMNTDFTHLSRRGYSVQTDGSTDPLATQAATDTADQRLDGSSSLYPNVERAAFERSIPGCHDKRCGIVAAQCRAPRTAR